MFKKAEKSKAWLKISLIGPSGSGKTFSALSLASGLGKKIALIDTENHSASLYADKFDFDVIDLQPPYTVRKYLDAMKLAVDSNYEILIIDSISHAWASEGGILDRKAKIDLQGGNSFTNWSKFTPEQNQFIAGILNINLHLICTMRSKQEYVLEMSEKGKTQVKRMGLAPIQRDGLEYEFTTMFEIGINHQAIATKDRTGLWDDQIFIINPNIGKSFADWLGASKGQLEKPIKPQILPADMLISKEERDQLIALIKAQGYNDKSEVAAFLFDLVDKHTTSELTKTDLVKVSEFFMSNPKANDFAQTDKLPFET